MRIISWTLLFFILASFTDLAFASPLVNTYSIVARDEKTGEMGVAVQSHWFAVGSRVAWAKAGVGVVATQAMTNASFGPKGLGLMSRGIKAERVLRIILASDRGAQKRQVALLDANTVAAHTGKDCIPSASHIVGSCYSVQANMMKNDKVVKDMARAFEESSGDLADRLLASLKAAQKAGGDIRGKQSASLKVVAGKKTGDPWQDVITDIRVDDNENPLKELSRLLLLSKAYRLNSQALSDLANKKLKEANEKFDKVCALAPNKTEFSFWYALELSKQNKWSLAIPLWRKVFVTDGNWRKVLRVLPGTSGLAMSAKKGNRLVSEIFFRTESKVKDFLPYVNKLAHHPFGTGAVLVIRKNNKEKIIARGTIKNKSNKVSAHTLFNIASVSKSLTSALAVSLCNEGKLNYLDSVKTHLPGVTLLSNKGADVSDKITVSHLLKNRSGLPHHPGKQLNPKLFDNDWHSPDLYSKLTRNWTLRLEHPIGDYHYSNTGFVLLAAMIEKAARDKFVNVMADYLKKQKLVHATFNPRYLNAEAAYGRVFKNSKYHFWNPSHYSSMYAAPYTGAWISMAELASFGQLLLKASDEVSHPLHLMAMRHKKHIGYGLGIVHQYRFGHSTLEHDGCSSGFLCRLIVVPEKEMVITIATNGGGETAATKDFRLITDNILITALSLEKFD